MPKKHKKPSRKETVLLICAHPDDEILGAGGTIAKYAQEGKEVVADIKQWGCGQESMADWAQQKGQSRAEMLDAHDEDIREIKRRADELEMPLEQYMGQLFTAAASPDTEANNDA